MNVVDADVESHPARGAWIEIFSHLQNWHNTPSHPARGAWIEIKPDLCFKGSNLSHPARGAWIEIGITEEAPNTASGRTPRGVRGLKYIAFEILLRLIRRTPRGVRGLKLVAGRSIGRVSVAPREGCVD